MRLWLAVAALGLVPCALPQTRLRYLDFGAQGQAQCMTVDSDGNIYVAGTEFRASPDAPQGLVSDIVIRKLDSNLGVLYTFRIEGNGSVPAALAVDAQGNLFVVGATPAPDYPLVNPLVSPPPGWLTGFVSKLDPAGKQLLFSTFLGGKAATYSITSVNAVALDAAGNVYVTGSTSAPDFPITANAYQKSGPSGDQFGTPSYAFVTKLTNSGDRILYSTFLGDAHTICSGGSACLGAFGSTGASVISIVADGDVVIAGSTTADKYPVTPGVFQRDCLCGYRWASGFITRLKADGSALRWSTFLGGGGAAMQAGSDSVQGLVLAGDGTVLVAGTTASTVFPTTPGAFQTQSAAQYSVFVTKLNSTAGALLFSTLLGGSAPAYFGGLEADAQGHPWVATYPYLGSSSPFLYELASDGSSLVQTQKLPNGSAGKGLALDPSGAPVLLGATGSVLRIRAGSDTALLGQANTLGSSVSGHVVPGEFITLYGTGLGPASGAGAQFDANGKIATLLAGTAVYIGQTPAPLLYVSAEEVRAIVPFEVSGEAATFLTVRTPSGMSETLQLGVVESDPGIFTILSENGPVVAAMNQDGTLNSPSNPARQGSIVTFWAAGEGVFMTSIEDGSIVSSPLPAPALPVAVWFGDQIATVTYAGAAPGMVAGVMQVNFRIPEGLSPGFQPTVLLQAGDNKSIAVPIAVQ